MIHRPLGRRARRGHRSRRGGDGPAPYFPAPCWIRGDTSPELSWRVLQDPGDPPRTASWPRSGRPDCSTATSQGWGWRTGGVTEDGEALWEPRRCISGTACVASPSGSPYRCCGRSADERRRKPVGRMPWPARTGARRQATSSRPCAPPSPVSPESDRAAPAGRPRRWRCRSSRRRTAALVTSPFDGSAQVNAPVRGTPLEPLLDDPSPVGVGSVPSPRRAREAARYRPNARSARRSRSATGAAPCVRRALITHPRRFPATDTPEMVVPQHARFAPSRPRPGESVLAISTLGSTRAVRADSALSPSGRDQAPAQRAPAVSPRECTSFAPSEFAIPVRAAAALAAIMTSEATASGTSVGGV